MNLEQQTRALLELVDGDRKSRIEALLGEARDHAAALRAQAGVEARERMRQAFAELRALRRERVAAAKARLDTQRRLNAQQRTSALLQLAWQQYPDELIAHWQEPATRAAWIEHVLRAARARIAPGDWCITHPADWPPEEQSALADTLREAGHGTARFQADPRSRAGLKITAGGNVIDGTLDGLLAERAEFETRLLRRLEAAT